MKNISNREESIAELQKFLHELSLYSSEAPRVYIDGIYDEVTRDAVRRFQLSVEIEPTGVADEDTWQRLYSEYQRVESNKDEVWKSGDRFLTYDVSVPHSLEAPPPREVPIAEENEGGIADISEISTSEQAVPEGEDVGIATSVKTTGADEYMPKADRGAARYITEDIYTLNTEGSVYSAEPAQQQSPTRGLPDPPKLMPRFKRK